MSDIVAEITKQRGSVYGPFLHNAIVAQAIKAAMRRIPDPDNEGLRWENLPLDVREGLDLIALKMSRIVTGDHEYLDNWDDIGGYAKIVADRIRGNSR
jgi:delta-aminolevulinic acid dehydratase/porphobilinogen synthase